MKFASHYVADQVTQRIYAERDKVKQFLRATEGESRYGALRGYLYEPMVHTILRNGGKFSYHKLRTGKSAKIPTERTLELERTVLTEFSNISEINEEKKFYRPKQAKFPALIAPKYIFQITTGLSHPIPMARLADIANHLATLQNSNTPKIKLFFVLPPHIYPSFRKQLFHTLEKQVAPQIPSILLKVKQYAICMSFD